MELTSPMTVDRSAAAICPWCGWPESQPYEVVSRHYTSGGVIEYTRCACGLLQVRYRNAGASRDSGRLVARAAEPATPKHGMPTSGTAA